MRHALLFLTALLSASAQTRPSATLETASARAVIDRLGGSIVRFELRDLPLNPLVWNDRSPGLEARPMGHFLCLDRWGQPSEAEASNGMPFHGEATRVEWKAESRSKAEVRMTAHLPMAGLDVTRTARLHEWTPVLIVTETVANRNKLGRPYNMVQHPTIGPPFLDTGTVVDSNARRGLMQSSPLPNPEEPSVWWPQALKDGQPVNLRHLTTDPDPNVVSFVIDEQYGWVTAATASKELLIGYIWATRDYPWLNIWRHVENGRPQARGLEFGTTGLHQPFPVLVKKNRIFGRGIFEWIEPGQTHDRSYAAFLLRIPKDYQGVSRVAYKDGRITVEERGGNRSRDLTLSVGELP
ncbi:MAG: hypothetical protein HY235_02405 [Acidobacteria bacterium]|nr:hypothetical protein [Acidobacteriota bacterium]